MFGVYSLENVLRIQFKMHVFDSFFFQNEKHTKKVKDALISTFFVDLYKISLSPQV